MKTPSIKIISGPNGSGKTTFVYKNFKEYIDQELFLNADEIAKELRKDFPFESDQSIEIKAAKIFLQKRDQFIQFKKSFIFETTLATRALYQSLTKAKASGYKITLYYLYISNASLCDFRVKERVSKGGHNIPFDNTSIFTRHIKS